MHRQRFFHLGRQQSLHHAPIQDGEPERLKAFLGWLLSAAKAYAPKMVNPGGVEVWKQHQGGNVHSLDSLVEHFDVTPRQIIRGVAQAADELRLPHRVHIHANNLGLPGNWTTTLETMRALEGFGGHMTHIQFHSYGGGDGDENTFNSKTVELADYVNAHREHHGRRRPGAVRPNDQHDRRRAARLLLE